jgi:hypothetical protein
MTKGMRTLFWAGVLMVVMAGEAMKAQVTGVSAEFLAYLQQHPCAVAPLDRIGDTNEQSVDVMIDGQPVNLVFDSGATRTLITANCARRLHLNVQPTKMAIDGVGGVVNGTAGVALIHSFTIRGYSINRTNTIAVFPKAAKVGWGHDGYFGLDFMHLNGAVIPVGGHCFLFKPGAEPMISLDAYLTRLGFRRIKLTVDKGGFVAMGHLNGEPFRARIDSGAGYTVFDRAFVRKVVGEDDLAITHIRAQGLDGEKTDQYRFTPSSLDLEGVSIPPLLMAAADIPGVTSLGDKALFGFDLLSIHGADIDTGTGTLWMK